MTEKKKTKRIKKEKYETEEQIEIKRFIKILLVIIIIVLGVYLLTRIFVTKDLLNGKVDNETITPGEINYKVTNIGSMFNKTEEEYYVIMYKSDDIKSSYYNGLTTTYERNTNALKVYTVDLDNELNKKYIDAENENINTNNLAEFKVGNLALIKIKNGKIIKALSTEEEIDKELAYIKLTES